MEIRTIPDYLLRRYTARAHEARLAQMRLTNRVDEANSYVRSLLNPETFIPSVVHYGVQGFGEIASQFYYIVPVSSFENGQRMISGIGDAEFSYSRFIRTPRTISWNADLATIFDQAETRGNSAALHAIKIPSGDLKGSHLFLDTRIVAGHLGSRFQTSLSALFLYAVPFAEMGPDRGRSVFAWSTSPEQAHEALQDITADNELTRFLVYLGLRQGF